MATLLLLQWGPVQNRLVDYATKSLSKTLKTEVGVGAVDFSLFNRFILEDILVRDEKKDTLLYAGNIKVRITDWFFLKENITLHYLGIEKGFVKIKRSDSSWNHEFILNAFSSTSQSKSGSKIKFDIEKIEIKALRVIQEDGWRGEDIRLSVKSMVMFAKDIDLVKKTISLGEIKITEPYLAINQYKGKRPTNLIPKTIPNERWNPEGWKFSLSKLEIVNGLFSSDVKTKRTPYTYFDADHLKFNHIDGTLKNVTLNQDTLFANVFLKADERSGFKVNSLKANVKFHPKEMAFEKLEIITPYSNIGNYFSMGYDSFNDDIVDFISNIKLKGEFRNAKINFKDISFFAPEVNSLSLELKLDGKADGTISNLKASGLKIGYGKQTLLSGDFNMSGLPDENTFRYAMQNLNLQTIPEDIFRFSPTLKNIQGIDLKSIGRTVFSGKLEGNTNNLFINGNLNTGTGIIVADLKLKNIASTAVKIDLKGELVKFNASAILGITELGAASGKFNVQMNGNNNLAFKTELDTLRFNNYSFKKINSEGDFKNKTLHANIQINDYNLEGSLAATINLKGKLPHTILDAQILSSNLKQLNLFKLPLDFAGRTHAEFDGDNLDNINGEMKFYDLIVFRNDQAFVMDSLYIHAENQISYRKIDVQGSDIDISMQGNFDFALMGNTFNQYFSKYYPLYFDKVTPLKKDQDIAFTINLKNTNSFLKIIDNGISGFNNSKITGGINTRSKLFNISAVIPKFSYNNLAVYDYTINASGSADSLIVSSKASSIVFNDSLSFPNNEINIRSSLNVSQVNVKTFSEQSQYGANLSAVVSNLADGIQINFNPSSLVFNEKTWNIEKDGEVLISRSKLNANNFKLSNGDQEISIIALPPEANSPQNIILTLSKVNLGDLLPFVLKEPRIQGITTGDLTIEDPFDKLKLYLNAQTDKTRFENDSIGITTINAFWDNTEKRASYFLESTNPEYLFGIRGKLNLSDSSKEQIDTEIKVSNVKLSILEKYLDIVFSEIDGTGNGALRIHGDLKEPDLTGKIKVTNGKFTVAYTQCTYKLDDPIIEFKPDMIDFGTIQLKDIYGNSASIKGNLEHHFFKKFKYNINASSRKMLVMNTKKENNNLFHGKAIARFNFGISGPEADLKMLISAAPVDSSTINILTSGSSKQSADVDFIVWKAYGKEMKMELNNTSSNLTIDLDLTATPLLKMNVVLDELTGDVISGIGNGNIKIHTGTRDNLSILGRYNIESGNYNFNFQDIFKKPFKLVGGGNSYISWTGDPYNAEINIDAVYLAEKVRMSTLFTDPSSSTVSGVSSDVLREISDVEVRCNLAGTLNKPNPTFQVVIPQNSSVKNNATIDSKLKNINRDALEVSKQATYLIVFKSFAPQAAVVANDLNSELINTTISGVINGILSSSIQNFFSKILGETVDVNLNYSRTLTSAGGTSSVSNSTQNNFRENVSLQFIKSLVNDKLIISFGSDFNFSSFGSTAFSSNTQSFLFLPDVNVEYKITPDGKFRTSFFYRSSFDLLSTSGKRDRTGGNVSFRTEFDRLFEKKKKLPTQE